MEADVDYVFVLKYYGSQKQVSEVLNNSIPASLKENVHSTSSFCLDMLYRIICNYHLSPCGNSSYQFLPRSICPDECNFVKNECLELWETFELRLTDYGFINCDETKALLFPLPSCCVEVGLQSSEPEVTNINSKGNGGAIGGSVVAILLVVGAIATALFVYITLRWRRRRALKFHLDIFAS